MQLRVLSLLIILVLAYSCNSEKSYKLEGNIDGIDEGKVYLFQKGDNQNIIIDSVSLTKGNFLFTGTIPKPDIYYLGLNNLSKSIELVLENSEIQVIVNKKMEADIKGSVSHIEYKSFENKFFSYMMDNSLFREKLMNAAKKREFRRFDILQNEYQQVHEKQMAFITSFLKDNSNSLLSPLVCSKYVVAIASSSELEEFMKSFDPSLLNSHYCKLIEKQIASMRQEEIVVKLRKVGEMAPDFTLQNPKGEDVSLSDFRGKYVLLDFWASWCGPCRKEVPNVVREYNKYKEKGFEVLGVSLDNKKEAWEKAITAHDINWVNISDLKGWDSPIVKLYNVRGVPHTLLLDKEGRIIALNLRGEGLAKKLAEIFE